MTNRRPRIPADLKNTVLYKAGHACCVCRDGNTRVQIHHIDGDPSNNAEDNLVALCMPHHDEAELRCGLTRRLDADTLRDFKARWEQEVAEAGRLRVSVAARSTLEMRQWNYFDFPRILSLAAAAKVNLNALVHIAAARQKGLLTVEGLLVDPPSNDGARTVFYALSKQDADLLHAAYTEMVEAVLRAAPPVHLKWCWRRNDLRMLAERSAIVYANRAFRFSVTQEAGRRECRIVRYTKDGILLQFVMDTWNVYSNSALTLHFTGYHRIGAVLLLRSAEVNEVEGRKRLVVNATPLVCGTGFPPDIDHAPSIAFREEELADELDPF